MIFNVGSRRSGTFWLQRIVTAHPEVAAVPSETHLFSSGIAPLFECFQHSLRSSTKVGEIYVACDAASDWGLDDAAFERLTMPFVSATDGRRKLIRREGRDLLHDLRTDPLELSPRDLLRDPPSNEDAEAIDSLRRTLDHPAMAATALEPAAVGATPEHPGATREETEESRGAHAPARLPVAGRRSFPSRPNANMCSCRARPPSCMPTSTRSTPRSSSVTTLASAAGR